MTYPKQDPHEVDVSKVTEWFPFSQNPDKPGYYQFAFGGHKLLSCYYWYWDGSEWFYTNTKNDPYMQNTLTHWRGLKEEFKD